MIKKKKSVNNSAMAFIILMAIVSLFSDMTHEGAKSILGVYLSLAGASAAVIGFVSGLGEFVGYSLRMVTGYLADKSKKYWLMTILGYAIDVFAIPLLALVPEGGWIVACSIIVIQRAGKAIKKPAKNTLVSFAASVSGQGKSFAVSEFLDQIGAFLGPIILFLVLLFKGNGDTLDSYKLCFIILGIPAIITLLLLIFAKKKYPNPETFEKEPENPQPFKLKKPFIFYLIGISLFAFGFVDFTLITLHVSKTNIIPSVSLPLLYSGAMVVDAFAALIFGFLYDKKGIKVLMISSFIAAFFAPLIFLTNNTVLLFVGVGLWGVGMGAQESILKAAVSSIVSKNNRSTGFGIFETSFGLFWFIGSAIIGALYDYNILAMVIISVVVQLLAIPFFFLTQKYYKKRNIEQ
ncbi:MAG: MFS transporter [Clostridia bacterium]